MKLKLLQLMLLMAVVLSPLYFSNDLLAQTTGTLTFTVNPVSHSGSYGTSHVVAIWIENSSSAFVKTKLRDAATNHTINNHLLVWKASSNLNVVDATTGATLTSYNPITIVWNATDVSAATVTDGNYYVWVECSWDEGTSGTSTTSVQFAKGISPITLTPANTTNFSGMSLSWVPTGVGIDNNLEKENFSISPNPVTNQSTINYSVNKLTDVTISLFDINGKLVNVLFDKNQDAGNYSLPLSVKGKVKSGIYFVKMYTGETQHTERVLISE